MHHVINSLSIYHWPWKPGFNPMSSITNDSKMVPDTHLLDRVW